MLKRIFAFIILLSAVMSQFAPTIGAQDYRFEAGAALGMSGYLGDANKSNLLKNPGFAGGIVFRYIMNYRWALKASFNTASISGNSANFSDVFPGEINYKFKSQLYDLNAQMEFNFFNFGIGYKYKNLHRISPYLTAGIGATMGVCDGSTSIAMSIPVGLGVKYKVSERVNLAAQFTMHKVLGDKIDNFTLDSLNGIKSSTIKNTDWFSLLMFSVTYEFGKKCETCHYKD